MDGGGKKGSRGHGKPDQGARKDRRSATGMNGEPKKGGHGGKFTWSGDQHHIMNNVEQGVAAAALDAKDPNFEDDDDDQVTEVAVSAVSAAS